MKNLLSILFVFTSLLGFGQLEINSMLINACQTNPDGENFSEIVEFTTTTDVDVTTLTGDYTISNGGPHSSTPSWDPSMNATTASKVAALNSTIKGCGLILEPLNGTIPAGKKVFFIRSEQMNPTDHDYTSLDDTIYMIFNTVDAAPSAVFSHTYSGGSLRERGFSISLNGQTIDSVRYQVMDLTSFENGGTSPTDGDRADFADNWTNISQTTYSNRGCLAAPLITATATTVNLSDTNACIGQGPINLTATTNATLDVWYLVSAPNGGVLVDNGDNTATYTPSTNDADAGDVLITYGAGNKCDDAVRDTVTIHVTAGLNLTITSTETPTNDTVTLCGTTTTDLNVTHNGTAPTFVWNATPALTTPLTVTPTDVGSNSTSQYIVTGTEGCRAGTDTIYIRTADNPDSSITITSGNTDLCFAQGAPGVTLSSAGNASNTYNWSGSNGSSGTGSTFTDTATASSGTVTYSLTVSSTLCGALPAATRTVNLHPQIGIGSDTITVTTPLNDFSVCATGGAPLDLIASLTNASNGTPFIWNPGLDNGNTPIVTGTDDNTATVNLTDRYQVSYTDPFGCGSDSKVVSVDVELQPTATITSTDTTICAGGDITLTADYSNGTGVTWYSGTTPTTVAQATIPNTGTTGTSTFVLESGGGGAISNQFGTTLTFWAVNSGNTCDSGTAPVTITILPNFETTPTLSATTSDTVCTNLSDTIQLYAPGINQSILQNTYTWTTTDPIDPVLIDSSGSDFRYYSIPGSAGESTYSLTIDNQCASDKPSNTLTIYPAQAPSGVSVTALHNDSLSCLFEDVILNASATGKEPLSYTWYKNGVNMQVLDTTLTTITDRQNLVGLQTYFITVSNECSKNIPSAVDSVNVRSLPVFNLVIPNLATANTDSVLCGDGRVTLQVQSNEALNWDSTLWSNGYQGQSPVTVTKAGTYTVTVQDTSSYHACKSQNSITIEPCPALIHIPSSFTPNGDGHNDEFYMVGVATLDIRYFVYDRWGGKVFTSTHLASSKTGVSETWNGGIENDKTKPAPEGTYIWYAQYYGDFDGNGVNYGTQMGTVTLIR